MLVTEAVARTKYCHQSFDSKCCASDCMAWRWSEYKSPPGQPGEPADTGYCGLAGVPSPPKET